MAAFFLITTLLALSSAKDIFLATDLPCTGEGCPNITVYLGPRWGSKVIYPNYPKVKGPSEQEVEKVNLTLSDTDTQVELMADAVDHDRRVPVPKHRPLPEDGSIGLEILPESNDNDIPKSISKIPLNSVHRLPLIFDLVMVDFSEQNLTGDEVKAKLSDQRKDLRQVRHLYLDNNNIRYLPVLTFPVEMEYGLVELSLAHNPLDYLSTYTRFELSRLGNLKILNLADTGLFYTGSLYLPTLQVLDLSDNYLSSMNVGLESLGNLEELNLSGNRISTVYGLSLSHLTHLRVLNLANNSMTYLWHDAFQSLYNLEKLYLNNNLLKTAFQVQDIHVNDLYLSGNPWKCDCPLLDLVDRKYSKVIDKDNLTCMDENSQFPRRLTSLTRQDVKFGCVGWRTTLKHAMEKLEWTSHRVSDYVPRLSTIFSFLGCVLFAILILRALRTSRRKVVPLEVPYEVLDNKQPL